MIEELSPTEYRKRRDAGELWQLLDVRESWEIAISRIEEAVHIPMREVPARTGELDRAMPVAVMCHSGVRSAAVARYLVASGFRPVANIAGGIDAWSLEVDAALARY